MTKAGAERAEAGEQIACGRHQRAAQIGLLDTLAAASEENAAEPLFKSGNVTRQGWLADAEHA
jgi:hypothetical protein